MNSDSLVATSSVNYSARLRVPRSPVLRVSPTAVPPTCCSRGNTGPIHRPLFTGHPPVDQHVTCSHVLCRHLLTGRVGADGMAPRLG